MLPRITEFVHNSFPIVADPEQATRKSYDIFGVYLIDKQGVVRTAINGTKEARPRLDVIVRELAKIEGVEAPRILNAMGKIIVPSARAGSMDRAKIANRDVLRVRWMWSHDVVRPGDRFRLAFLPLIAEGFHVYANNEEKMTPFRVDLELPEGIELEREPIYPRAEARPDPVLDASLAYYENDIPLSAFRLKASKEMAPGEVVATARLHFQACDDSICLAPTVKVIRMPLTIAPTGSRRGQVFGWQTW